MSQIVAFRRRASLPNLRSRGFNGMLRIAALAERPSNGENSVTTRLSRGCPRRYQEGMTTTHPRLSALAPALCVVMLGSCGDDDPANTTGEPPTTGTSTSTPMTAGEPTTTGSTTGADGAVGLALLPRLAGLWSGPATMTPLGTFQRMNVDMRAASSKVLFGRVDLDAANSLRFAFEIEAPDGEPTLVYRNGGYFLGVMRDSRTRLVEHDVDAGTWRFCSTDAQGCDYIDAQWRFSGADALVFEVKVKGKQHVYWDAKRSETQPLPEPFPADLEPLASDAAFPPMPALALDVRWPEALPVDGAVWVILTTMDCDLQFKCIHSRSLMQGAPAGATSATLTIDQIHPGPYKLNVILDRNGNLASTLYPDKGDGIGGLNQALTVAPTGTTEVKATISLTL